MAGSNKPLTLSIIIPAYNEAHHLRGCLEAIRDQTVAPDEVIVVDNNSTDETATIAREFPFVTLLKEKKQGVVYARDCGFDAAKSDIIGRIDADSVLSPHWAGCVKRYYQNPDHANTAVTGGGYPRNFIFKKTFSWVWHQIVYRFNRVLMGHYILWGSNMAFTRQQWRGVRKSVCRDTSIHEDLDLAIHLHRAGRRIVYRDELIVGVTLRRWLDSDRKAFLENLLLWPNTLRKHRQIGWIGGWLGAYLLYILSFPIWLAVRLYSWIRRSS